MPELFRVEDKDTGHKRTVTKSELAHGNYRKLNEPAVDPVSGDVVPPELARPESLSSKSNGQKATTSKENDNG